MSEFTKPKRSKSGTKSGVIYARIPAKLEMVIKRQAELRGRSIADHTRLIFEMAAHFGMLTRLQVPEEREAISKAGKDPDEYEAAILDELRASFLEVYGAPMPEDAYDLLSAFGSRNDA